MIPRYLPRVELACVIAVDAENPTEGDLRLSGGNLVWLTDLSAEVAQRLTVRLNFFKGEWWYDQNQGTPYYQQILVKDPDISVLRAVFSRIVLDTPGVATITRLDVAEPDANREVAVTFEARLTDGTRFRSQDFPPFIVRVP